MRLGFCPWSKETIWTKHRPLNMLRQQVASSDPCLSAQARVNRGGEPGESLEDKESPGYINEHSERCCYFYFIVQWTSVKCKTSARVYSMYECWESPQGFLFLLCFFKKKKDAARFARQSTFLKLRVCSHTSRYSSTTGPKKMAATGMLQVRW